MSIKFNRNRLFRRSQKGAITMISAVLILVLLTEMIFYAVQTGVFEQRKSGNEMRQKIAFHVADAAIQQAKQFMFRNSIFIASDLTDLVPIPGTANFQSGWLSAGNLHWLPCAGISDVTHPCFAESNAGLRANSYYYSFADTINPQPLPIELPQNPQALRTGGTTTTEDVTLHALLCMLDVDPLADPVVQGCTTDATRQDRKYFMVTLAARGEADCNGANGTDCTAQALISEKIGSFGPGGGDGGPAAPLTARTTVELSGTVEIVPNPNGGGIGVPISTLLNGSTDPLCNAPADPADPVSGSWSTCERHEWYGQASLPDDYKCTINNGNGCACKESEGDRLLSYRDGNVAVMSIDVVVDPGFPCDLFEYTFGIPKANWTQVRDMVPPENAEVTECSELNEGSHGMYWISVPDCVISTTQQVGSPNAPVFLVSAVDTRLQGDIYGVLFITDVENPAVEFTGNGHGTIYGAAIMEATMKNFNGTFQIVWVDGVVELALGTGQFGGVQGGWTDFHASWQ